MNVLMLPKCELTRFRRSFKKKSEIMATNIKMAHNRRSMYSLKSKRSTPVRRSVFAAERVGLDSVLVEEVKLVCCEWE